MKSPAFFGLNLVSILLYAVAGMIMGAYGMPWWLRLVTIAIASIGTTSAQEGNRA